MIFGIFQRKRMNNQIIKKDSDKIKKRLIRTAKKQVKNGMLPDSHSLASFLVTVDGEYAHLNADIDNLTRVADYEKIRAETYARTERDLTFYSTQHHELQNLYKIVSLKAKETGRTSELSGDKLDTISTAKLQEKFHSLNRNEQDWTIKTATGTATKPSKTPQASMAAQNPYTSKPRSTVKIKEVR